MLFTIFLAVAIASSANAAGVPIDWRQANRCGPNALYVMLVMNGLSPDYDRLIAGIDITEKGASISDLLRASAENGLPLVAVKTTIDDLAQFSTPALLHYQPSGELGHYAVLLRANSDNTFSTIEATRGAVEIQAMGDFLSRWSGVVLIKKSDWDARQDDRRVLYLSVAIFVAFLLAILLCLRPGAWGLLRSTRSSPQVKQLIG